MQFFGGEAGETLAQIVARLPAKDRDGARAGAVRARLPIVEDVPEQVEILLHEVEIV